MPTLEILYEDNINNSKHVAKIHKTGAALVIEASPEDLELYLRNLSDTAPYTQYDDDVTVLRSIATHLPNGVNRFSFKSHHIIK